MPPFRDERPSPLIHRTAQRRPMIDRAQGIYIWDREGKRYIDGSSGPLTCTIGHGNERVLKAMAEQASQATFAYPINSKTSQPKFMHAISRRSCPPRSIACS